MKRKILNLKVTYKGILSILLVVVAVAFLIARFPDKLAQITGGDSGAIHGLSEKIYTIALILVMFILGISVVANPLVMGLILLAGASLIYHLVQKFR
jgi:hypothetical protein